MAMPNLHSIPAMAIAIVATALISISATIGMMQWAMVIPAADPPSMHKLVTDVSNRIDGRITETLGNTILCIEEVQALRKDWKTPARLPAPALKKAGG
jgi:hypothetical protein